MQSQQLSSRILPSFKWRSKHYHSMARNFQPILGNPRGTDIGLVCRRMDLSTTCSENFLHNYNNISSKSETCNSRTFKNDQTIASRRQQNRLYSSTPFSFNNYRSSQMLLAGSHASAALASSPDTDDDYECNDPYVSPFTSSHQNRGNQNVSHRTRLRRPQLIHRDEIERSALDLELGEGWDARGKTWWDERNQEEDDYECDDEIDEDACWRNHFTSDPIDYNTQHKQESRSYSPLSPTEPLLRNEAQSLMKPSHSLSRKSNAKTALSDHFLSNILAQDHWKDETADFSSQDDDEHVENLNCFSAKATVSEEYWPAVDGRDNQIIIEKVDLDVIPQPDKKIHTNELESQRDENKSPTETNTKSALEYLAAFDPQNPPATSNLEELQIWLECEAQQEAVLRFQKVIDDARDRKDFSALSMVQKQVLRWFYPVQEEISKRQREYVMKDVDDKNNSKSYASRCRYGPYLCTLPPAKLAVIASHEAIMYILLKGNGNSKHGQAGASFTSLAKKIGESVEEEVIVHRLLHKRYKEAQRRLERMESLSSGNDVQENLLADELSATDQNDVIDDDDLSDSTIGSILNADSDSNVTHKWAYASSHLKKYLDEIGKYQMTAKKRHVIKYAIKRARHVLDRDEEWPVECKVQLGAALIQILLGKATILGDGNEEMAFVYEKRWTQKDKTQSFVMLNDRLYDMIVNDKLQSFGVTTNRYKPMIVRPKPWTKFDEGGYKMLRSELMRFHGCNTQKEVLRHADLSIVFDGLNALGSVKWKVNKTILEVAKKCWENNVPLGDIPSRTDFDIPPEPVRPQFFAGKFEKDSEAYRLWLGQQREYQDSLAKFRRMRQKNMDLRSLRCSVILKLDQAEKFQDFDQIFFPYNMDFRGRAYPIPPHFSNLGSDLCRGMLMFAEPKPLGVRGFYWLKVHLANLAGKDKMVFDDRVAFVESNMDKIRDAVNNPFFGEQWWMSLDDPFQGLATCHEIVAAIDSGDPSSYMCSLPVHMDGSCNGLQHYAALARDPVGGKAVNLCTTNEPQDVYAGVMHEVIRRVAHEAERKLDFDTNDVSSLSAQQKREFYDNRAAKLVNGLIDRGVVKRTVMTSVYGVTYIGARLQIQEKIENKLEAQGYDVDENKVEIFQACGYLAKVTMKTIGELYSGAKETMDWLTTCARMISQHGYPVAWISPIGVPAIQPYRQKKSSTLVTLLQTVTLTSDSDDLPIHRQRQVSAFPPNFIHSLDSSHMLLTALEMDRRGLTFSAVHDSYWTHPSDVDEMNEVLREVFVDMYSQPVLERVKMAWEMRYPDLVFPDLPTQGTLDLHDIKKARYFFQ